MKGSGATVLLMLALFAMSSVSAQTMYKYRGDDGEWIYTDRPPDDGKVEEMRDLATGDSGGSLDVSHSVAGRVITLTASNRFYAPLEIEIEFSRIVGVAFPHPDHSLRWVLPPRSQTDILQLPVLESVAAPEVSYTTRATIGDPDASHAPRGLYRVPYAIASDYPVTQAFPDAATHNTPDSRYAVDMAMPVGTDIFAARGGIVIDIADTNFRGGLDPERDAPSANVVRILHEDGTYAVYAHLNWNSIRVRPGQRVERGEYIADSGNTGYSSGPHLHFAVIRNTGMRSASVPVRFEGANSSAVVPASGRILTAH